MALIYIHGVMTRRDASYEASKMLRRTMIEREILPGVRVKFPRFAAAEDVFWGDLAMRPLIDLNSFFEQAGRAMGAGEGNEGLDEDAAFAEAYELSQTVVGLSSPTELGQGDDWLLALARANPGMLVRALSAPERVRYDEAYPPPPPEGGGSNADEASAANQGEADALWILAIEQAADDSDLQGRLRLAASVDEVAGAIADAVTAKYGALTDTPVASSDGEMGTLADTFAQLGRRVSDRCARVKDGAVAVARAGQRQAWQTASTAFGWGASQLSPILLRRLRGYAPNLLPFLGDVFVYLRRGHNSGDPTGATIADQVCQSVRAAATLSRERDEPLVVISHSFGGPILYDQLVSGRLDDVTVDLWVTAGSQVGLFAALDLYGRRGLAGRPAGVCRWINIHNPNDPFSFPTGPVFGDVVDELPLTVRETPIAAHSAYFAEPAFYAAIKDALLEVTWPR